VLNGSLTTKPIIKGRYEKNSNGSPKLPTRILQNKLDQNSVRLTTASATKKQLLKPHVKFVPKRPEICDLVYNNPCTCKKPTVTLTV
jgi:hypothetical protein